MSAGLTGMLLGLLAAVGLVLAISYAPPFRSVRLVDRLAPTSTTPRRPRACSAPRPSPAC
jgi:hypothetical protein